MLFLATAFGDGLVMLLLLSCQLAANDLRTAHSVQSLNIWNVISQDICDRLYTHCNSITWSFLIIFGMFLCSKLPVIPQEFCHSPDSPCTGTISRKFGSPCVSWASVPGGFTTPPLPTALLGRALGFLQLQASGCNWWHVSCTSLQILILVLMVDPHCSGGHA